MDIHYSRHAREQMVARGVEEEQVKEAMRGGEKHIQKPDRIVSDYKYFSVVYKKFGDNYFVITVKPRW